MTHKMIDVSSNNHNDDQAIDWHAVASAGYSAVMIKATEGARYVNPWLERDATGAQEAGLLKGYYHYAHPGESAADIEVNNLWQTVKDLPRSIGLALDLEVSEGLSWQALDAWAKEFMARIPAEVTNRVLYTSTSWLAQLGVVPTGTELWLASWGRKPKQETWAWQYGQLEVPGIAGLTDVSTLYV